MSDLQTFNFCGVTVRTVVIDGAPWFVARDVAGEWAKWQLFATEAQQ